MRIAVDVMGGDHSPKERICGAINALSKIQVDLTLVGDQEIIEKELVLHEFDKQRVDILHAPEIIGGEEQPVKAIKTKKDSSIVVGLEELRHKAHDCFISAGSTGALLAGSLLKVGRIKGIGRPAICSVYPTTKGMALVLDVGANADCRPTNLRDFALMGRIYAQGVLGIENPRVGLVNIGHEEGKGNSLVKEAFPLIKESEENFVGNIEARDISHGIADVIVCDGFTGNVILKLTEGVAKFFSSEMKSIFTKSLTTKMAGLAVKSGFDNMKKMMDYTEYGGAPLLGVRELVVKAHGSSNAKAFMNAICYGEKALLADVVKTIMNQVVDD